MLLFVQWRTQDYILEGYKLKKKIQPVIAYDTSKKNVVMHVSNVINCTVARLQPHIDFTKSATYSASVVTSNYDNFG